jgi:hypothetical protein
MGTIIVPYASVQQAFSENPGAVHETVDQAATAAAEGDPDKRAQLIAQWNQALADLESADQGSTVVPTRKSVCQPIGTSRAAI